MLIFSPLRRKLQSLSLRRIIKTSVQRIEATAVYPQEYLTFLQEVLLTTVESNSNPEIVYPMLKNNLDKLDETFAEGLSQWADSTLPTIELKQAYGVAEVIFDFSTLIGEFPLGNRRSNLEIAIKGYQALASDFTPDAFPYEWANTQNNLGVAYWNRIRGEKAKNLEEAISCYRKSLKVYTPDVFPYDWAMTQTNLGNVYRDRIEGEKADNLETALACYRESLRVYSLEIFPYEWARTQNNLGNAYCDRIRGEKADNLETALACYRESLRVYSLEIFPYEWARTQNNLALAYNERIRGEKADNLETAISCLQESLKVCTPDAFPYEWANTQHNLALAYCNRIRGEKADNLEAALACYRESLKVHTPDAFPYEWATTQHNRGNAYCDRIRGEKADNLETALNCLQEALKVRTPDAFPYEWARTQNSLGNAYYERIRGKKADNLETAISCLQEALKVFTPDAFPEDWARTQTSLGSAYWNRIRGEKADNLEAALACYREALKVHTPDAFPYEWATTQTKLGVAYWNRIRGEKADNLETAISCLQEALKVCTPDAFPYEWANTQNNLGVAYCNRIRGEKVDNLEAALACYREALKVHTPDAFPYEWATTQTNLGNAYWNRIRGEKADNLETAISYYRESLKVCTPDAFPYEWATTQTNLGNAYCDRIRGEKADNLETAISCLQESLKVCTPDAFPLECLLTARILGNLAFKEGNWQLAIEAYKKAVEAVELSRSWAMTPQSKQEVMEAAIDVYYSIVQAYLNTEQNSLVLEYVERSKNRNLVELLATRDLKPKGDFSPAILGELDRLRDKLRSEQIFLANQERTYIALSRLGQPSQPSLPDRTRLKQLQQELDELIERDISPIDPNFSLTQKVEPIPFRDIQSLIDERTAIVEWYITGEKILAFLVTHHSPEPQVWQSSTEDLTNLVNWGNEYIESYDTNRQQWIAELETRLQNLAKILHLDKIFSILSDVIPECGSEALLKADRLILVPHRFLHLFPLHALPVSPQVGRRTGGEGKYLLDLFPRGVQYAPSCQLLKLAQNQQRPDFGNLFAIQNPTGDLIYTDLEVETIRSFLPSSEVLARQAATEEAVKNYQKFSSVHCGHFSCHGEFNPISPLESALILADNEHWTLGEIFELSLPQCRLVNLSACETGFIDPSSLSDEYIGLPNGFLFAGSPSVVSSLWTVDQVSTAFLMIKFYENLNPLSLDGKGAGGEGISVAIALQTAQKWLRDLTCQEFEQELTKPQSQKAIAQLQPKLSPADFFELEDAIEVEREKLKKFDLDDKPFANLFYWAAFVAIGV